MIPSAGPISRIEFPVKKRFAISNEYLPFFHLHQRRRASSGQYFPSEVFRYQTLREPIKAVSGKVNSVGLLLNEFDKKFIS